MPDDFILPWIADGHTLKTTLEYERVGLRIVCPGRDKGCEAHFGCERCHASGTVTEPVSTSVDPHGYVDKDCPACGGTGNDPSDDCWLVHWTSEGDGADSHYAGPEGTEFWPGQPIIWHTTGCYDAPDLEWMMPASARPDDYVRLPNGIIRPCASTVLVCKTCGEAGLTIPHPDGDGTLYDWSDVHHYATRNSWTMEEMNEERGWGHKVYRDADLMSRDEVKALPQATFRRPPIATEETDAAA